MIDIMFAAKESGVYRRLQASWWYEYYVQLTNLLFSILGGFGRFALR
jgi:hypothetical protein